MNTTARAEGHILSMNRSAAVSIDQPQRARRENLLRLVEDDTAALRNATTARAERRALPMKNSAER